VVAFVVVELPVTTRLPLIVEDADERNPARVLFPHQLQPIQQPVHQILQNQQILMRLSIQTHLKILMRRKLKMANLKIQMRPWTRTGLRTVLLQVKKQKSQMIKSVSIWM
jgi:hypothetical protein